GTERLHGAHARALPPRVQGARSRVTVAATSRPARRCGAGPPGPRVYCLGRKRSRPARCRQGPGQLCMTRLQPCPKGSPARFSTGSCTRNQGRPAGMREQNPLSTANSFGGTTTEMEDRAAGGYWLNRSFISFATARSPFPTSPVGDVRDFRGCPTINGSKWCRIGFARSCHPVPKARTGASKMPLYARYGVPYVWLVD